MVLGKLHPTPLCD